MKAQAMIIPKKYFFDKNGNPLAFGKVYTYQAGTTIQKETFTSESGDVANTNPVILNGEGYASIYLNGSYNIVVDDQGDNNIWTEDPVSSNIAEEWVDCETPIYISSTSFKITGNLTVEYEAGRRVRIDNDTPTYSYSTIISSSFSGGETTITITDPVITTGVVGICRSIIGLESVNYSVTNEALINDLSQTINLSVAQYKAFTKELPVGKKVYITDRDADFTVISGTGTGNNLDIIASDEVSQSITLTIKVGITIEQFGAIENTDSSLAIRRAITVLSALGVIDVIIPAKRYLYDRVAITNDNVSIKGMLKPKVNDAFTSLEGGSIIQGTIQFTGKNVSLKYFGADLGSATGEAGGDGIKCRYPTINAGGHLHTEGLIALLPAPSTPNHALLFESYQKHTGGNLEGVHGFFGFVNKCQNVQLNELFTKRNQSDGVYFKSDSTDGKCAKVNIDGINVDGNAGQTFGLRLQSAGDDIEDINISNVIIDGCARAYKADLNGTNGTSIKHVKIVNFLSKNASSRDIHVENAKSGGLIYDHKMKNVSCIDTLLEGYKVDGTASPDFIDVDGLFISYKTGVSAGQMEAGGVQIGSTVLRTKMDKIVVCQNWSVSVLGGINYSNQSANNQLGMYTGKIFGSMPLSGDSSQELSGATATLVIPTPAWNAKTCNARVTIAADTTITTFTENVLGAGLGAVFETGTILTVINNSGFNLTINHNFGGNILNRGGTPYVLAGNEVANYVYGGAVWHQL